MIVWRHEVLWNIRYRGRQQYSQHTVANMLWCCLYYKHDYKQNFFMYVLMSVCCYMYVYMCVYVLMSLRSYMYVYMCVYVLMSLCSYMYVYMCVCINECV